MTPFTVGDDSTTAPATCEPQSASVPDPLTQSVLDTLTDHIAILDRRGTVVATNAAWDSFARANQGDPVRCGVGTNYLEVCQSAGADDVLRGMTQILDGSLPAFEMDYPCHAPDQERWFHLRVAPWSGGGAVVTHTISTMLHRAEASIRAQEHRFRALVQNAADLVSILDRNGTLLYQSPALHRLLGFAPEPCVGANALAVVHPDDLGPARRALAELAAIPGGMTQREVRVRHQDGSWRRFDAIATNLLDDPDIRGIVINARDITQQAALRTSLQETERILRYALRAAHMGVWDWDAASGQVNWIGAENLSPHELPPGAFAADWQTALEHVHPDDRAKLLGPESEEQGLATGFVESDHRVLAVDGGVRWFSNWGLCVDRDDDGRPSRMVGVTMDSTTLKTVTAALTLRERAIDAASTGIMITDATTSAHPILDVNPAFERITGYAKAEVLGRTLGVLTGPDTDPASAAAFQAAVIAGREETHVLRCRRKDGAPFWNEIHVAPVRDAAGALTHCVGIVTDVTAQFATAAELRFRGELLDHATAAIIATDLAGVVTHWNRHAEFLYGWAAAEAIGRAIGDVTGASTDDAMAAAIVQRRAAGEAWEDDVVRRRKDGGIVFVHTINSPIVAADGQLIGHVSVSVDLSERKALEERLVHLATHDGLTDLANRALFADRLEHALRVASRRQEPVAVLTLDLDRFKWINDTLGHAVGDQVLVAVGQRLTACLRDGDTLARLGGDEFAIVLENATADMARDIAERTLAALAEPLAVGACDLSAVASIGIALSTPDRSTPAEVLRASDIALYRAKQTGGGIAVLFDTADHATQGWFTLDADLRGAVDRGELVLHYQPIISLGDERTIVVEALVRWQHPTRGLVPPLAFLPVAEETGVITAITIWVLGEACQQLATWRRTLGPDAPRTINVNVTTRDLRDPGLVDRVATALATAGLPASCLQLEITERVLVEELRAAAPALLRLRALGVLLAIDDFGAGVSSLASLHTVDASCLKLDRAFVAGLAHEHTQVVVAAVAAMAHALGMEITAEGIETVEQLALARAAGCDRGQGFLFTHPLPADGLTTWLVQQAEPLGTPAIGGLSST